MDRLEALTRSVRRHGTLRMVTDLDAPGSQLTPHRTAYISKRYERPRTQGSRTQ
jgi:hypothetical protein